MRRYLRVGPGVRLARISTAAGPRLRWHFWWQAQLLDCLLDALERAPSTARKRRVRGLARGIWLRNGGRWVNEYHDDIAWLGLALQRAGTVASHPAAIRTIVGRLRTAWVDDERGGVPWRRGDVFRNAPAAGPSAILLARSGFHDEAARLADWIHLRLTRPDGLIADGIRDAGVIEPTAYSYNQGTMLGADLEVGRLDRIPPLLAAVVTGLTQGGVLLGHGAGDGGLFGGIMARYLTLVALDPRAGFETRYTAADLVLTSADAAWRSSTPGPRFGPDWSSSSTSDDLSVQLGGWMLMEAAARIEQGQRPSRASNL